MNLFLILPTDLFHEIFRMIDKKDADKLLKTIKSLDENRYYETKILANGSP